MQNGGLGSTPFLDFLEETPQAAYFGMPGRARQTPNQRRFFEQQFRNVHNQFLGALGRQITSGQQPTLRFATDFLPGYDPQAAFLEQPFGVREATRGAFAPPIRYFYS